MKESSSISISTSTLLKHKLPLISRYSPSNNKLLYVNVLNNKDSSSQSMRYLNQTLNNVNCQYEKFKEVNSKVKINNKQFSKMYQLFYLKHHSTKNVLFSKKNNDKAEWNQTIENDSSFSYKNILNKTKILLEKNQPKNIFENSLILLPNNQLKYLSETQSTNATFQSEGNFLSKCALRLKRKDLSTLKTIDNNNSSNTNCNTQNISSAFHTVYSLNALKISRKHSRPIRNQIRDLNGSVKSFVSILTEKKEEEENDYKINCSNKKSNDAKHINSNNTNTREIKQGKTHPKQIVCNPSQRRKSLIKVYNTVVCPTKKETMVDSNKSILLNKQLINNYFKKNWFGNNINKILAM